MKNKKFRQNKSEQTNKICNIAMLVGVLVFAVAILYSIYKENLVIGAVGTLSATYMELISMSIKRSNRADDTIDILEMAEKIKDDKKRDSMYETIIKSMLSGDKHSKKK